MNHIAFANAIRRHASAMDTQYPQPRYAVVTSYDPATHHAKVQVQSNSEAGSPGVQSGWLPILTPATGNGWGIVAPLAPGQQVILVPVEGSSQSYAVVGAAFSQANPPPVPKNAIGGSPTALSVGEFAVVNRNGAVLRLNADGSFYAEASGAGSNLKLTNAGGIWHAENQAGNVSITLTPTDVQVIAQSTTFTITSGQITANSGSGTPQAVKLASGANSDILFAT